MNRSFVASFGIGLRFVLLEKKPNFWMLNSNILLFEDGVAQLVEHWTANLAARVRSPVGEEPSDLICAFLHVQMESNWTGLSLCNCRHTGK